MGITAIIIIGIIVLLGFFIVGIYNTLIKLKNRFKNAFAQIEVQLKRRHDLIPNLVETVKGYIKHERETLEAVIEARNRAVNGLQSAAKNPGEAGKMAELAGAEAGLTGALVKLFALAEAYPDLKANQNMMQLNEELTSTENKVSFSRQAYNDAVMAFNIYRQSFPAVILAGFFGHGEDAGLLEFESAEIAEPPKVKF
ncbi:MAG: hypothetical protein K940chlam3_01015 [Chlamydiae bacterium]|nr:hypothetical protein [Chlamydiota bacterium]